MNIDTKTVWRAAFLGAVMASVLLMVTEVLFNVVACSNTNFTGKQEDGVYKALTRRTAYIDCPNMTNITINISPFSGI